jgi:hypothetical protein
MLPTQFQSENTPQIAVLAMAPALATAFNLATALALSYLFAPTAEAVKSCSEASKEGGDLKSKNLKILEDKYQRLVENIAKSPQSERILVGQFVDDVFGGMRSEYSKHYENIKNDLSSIIIDKNVNVVPNLIKSFGENNRYDVIEKVFFLLDKKNIISDVLNLKHFAGYPTHLIFNQNFKMVTGLLEYLDESNEGRFIEILTNKDNSIFSSTILDATSLIGSVATPEFLDVVTKLYSSLAYNYPSFIKLKEQNLMLPSENFQEIFTEDYFKSLSPIELKKLSKLVAKIESSRKILGDGIDELVERFDLNPCTPYKEGGYEGTTLKDVGKFQTMLDTLKEGGCISIREDAKKDFLNFMKSQLHKKIATKLMSDESKITVVSGYIQGSVALGDGPTISSFIDKQINSNLEYIQNNLDKIKALKVSKVSPEPSEVETRDAHTLGTYRDQRVFLE